MAWGKDESPFKQKRGALYNKEEGKKRNVEKKGFHRNEMACPLTYDILKENAKANRMKMTDAERALWEKLKDRTRGVCFRRQHIIGDYIVDFACLKSKLVVEVDGEYHFTPEQQTEDKIRQSDLERMGFCVLRFSNQDVFSNIERVILEINNKL